MRSLLLYIIVTTLTFSLSSFGGAPENCLQAASTPLSSLLTQYLNAAEKGDAGRTRALILKHRIESQVFCGLDSPGFRDYRQSLLQIDQKAKERHALAIFELAKMLQFHWESRFGGQTSLLLRQNEENGAKIGLSLGILALAGSVIRQPQNMPRYFQFLRHLLPVAGTQLGAVAGNKLSQRQGAIPPSPASLMHLGLRESPTSQAEPSELLEGLTELSASIAAGSMAAEILQWVAAAQWVNRAITPLKLNLMVFAVSTAVGILAENGIAQAAEYIETRELEDRAHRALVELQLAHPVGNMARTHAAAEKLVIALTDLQNRLNRPITSALKESIESGQADPSRMEDQLRRYAEEREFQNDPASFRRNSTQDHQLAMSILRKGFSPNIQRMIRQAIAYLNCLQLPYLSDQIEILEVLLHHQMDLMTKEGQS